GREVLEQWMSVVAGERRTLDTVLERYWYRNARALRPSGARIGAERASFEVAAERSCLIVEARSNIGPIAFSTTSLRGGVSAALRDGLVIVEEPPTAHVELDMASLSSGNRIYDSELMQRVGARRHPEVTLDLVSARRLGDGNCYHADGELTLRGVTRGVSGAVTVTIGPPIAPPGSGGRRMTVAGEQVLDIREFDIEPPAWGALRIYPDVRLHLHLEAAEQPV
ncbi:MAG TPA: YceI family protein, partial [Acidimicrobiales bacterium]|nr:YceI family protein [Acidimicrobiales bacterium]